MSSKANKALIGIFVIGALTLAVAGVLFFGSGRFFTERDVYVLYFEGSVKGLNIGSPVMFRGVKIGSVRDIQLQFNTDDISVRIPVIIEVDPEKFITVGGLKDGMNRRKAGRRVNALIEKGLRAQLQLQSVVTGQLTVDFDFHPDEPARLIGPEDGIYVEIPTISSGLQKLTKKIEQLPLDELASKLILALEGIEQLVSSAEVRESFTSFSETLRETQRVLQSMEKKIEPVLSSLKEASAAARNTFVQAEKTLAFEEGTPAKLMMSIDDTLLAARSTLKKAEKTLSAVESFASDDSSFTYELNNTLRELTGAARSVRFLAEYLEQHPEALLRGKGSTRGY